jgi:hypothetical protein
MKTFSSLKQGVLLSLLLKTRLLSMCLLNQVHLGTIINPTEEVFDQKDRGSLNLRCYKLLTMVPTFLLPTGLISPNLLFQTTSVWFWA